MASNNWLDGLQSGLAANLPTSGATGWAQNTVFSNSAGGGDPGTPAYPGNKTAFYFATDTGVLYVWNPTTQAWVATSNKAPVAVGATLAASASLSGVTYLLNTAAGSVLTLPTASGSGLDIKAAVTVTTTSNAHKVLTNTTDDLIGNAVGQVGNAPSQFSAAHASGYHSLQMPYTGSQPKGGFEGDWYEFTDIASGIWVVKGMFQAGTTPTTPFSTATT